MNKIYRVLKKESLNSEAVGYLVDENESMYTIRVQNGTKNKIKKFSKDEYSIKSIYEVGTNETYQIKAKNVNGKNVTIELPKSCFGGCG